MSGYNAAVRRFFLVAILALTAVFVVRPRTAGSNLVTFIGRALRGVRSGDAGRAGNDATLRALPTFALESPAFADGAPMPAPYIDAGALQPPLAWHGVPPETVEIALIVEDVDVPFPRPLVHAIAYGLHPGANGIDAGAIPRPGHPDEGAPLVRVGQATVGRSFLAPTPIPGHGPHRYVFQAFALRAPLRFERPPNKSRLVAALREVAIAQATLTGTHER